jgi:hypothetical protein
MKIRLVNVGRGKRSYTTEVDNLDGALREARKHLLSSEVELVEQEEGSPKFDIVVGGFRKVGELWVMDL